MEIDPTIKSRPIYPPVLLDSSARLRVFVYQQSGEAALKPFFMNSNVHQIKKLKVSDVAQLDGMSDRCTPSNMVVRVQEILVNAPVATHLYVAGSEAFLWDVHKVAVQMGLIDEQIHLHAPTDNARRVFCTHCYTVMDSVLASPHSCVGCSRLLLVRDHFSRHRGAYVGLQVNAENPQESPIPEAF